MVIGQQANMARVWNTSKYHSKPSVSIFKVKVTQGHEVKKTKITGLGCVCNTHAFSTALRQEREKDYRALFERTISDKN